MICKHIYKIAFCGIKLKADLKKKKNTMQKSVYFD